MQNEGLEFLSPLLVLGVMTRLIGPIYSRETTTLGAKLVFWGRQNKQWKDLISDDTVKPRYEVTWELIC